MESIIVIYGLHCACNSSIPQHVLRTNCETEMRMYLSVFCYLPCEKRIKTINKYVHQNNFGLLFLPRVDNFTDNVVAWVIFHVQVLLHKTMS